MEDILSVGIITTAHGVRGEVKVFPTTDDVRRFKKCKTLLVEHKNEISERRVEGVKFFKQFVIIKLEGISTMDEALTYKNNTLYVRRKDAVKLEKDEYFITDLYGLKVYDEDKKYIGEITDVIQTGANDVYEITMEDESKHLIPAIKQCVLDVDMQERTMTIHVMEGLFDI
ncbi:MAG: ribosome maturation factor RimM [Lachnospiraceae bacterium]|nr:ribosome maturation factor RimM [Lachnospiraceae bacterium]